MYKGTPLSGTSTLLRSYDSRKEPAPEFNCTIWQAGRATSATGLAFKPIQIGQSVFLDEGAGKYNPSPQLLDEAAVNEWPGRDVGVFVSIGTGKRPNGTNHMQNQWWEGFIGSSVGDFAEARRRLISKIEGCEETHQYMVQDHLMKRGVNAEQYYRLNVEIGVGEFGMNEWNRLADISTNTRMYLGKQEIQSSIISAASKIARIHLAKARFDRMNDGGQGYDRPYSWDASSQDEASQVQPQPQPQPQNQTQTQVQGHPPQAQRYSPPAPDFLIAELPGGEVYELESPVSNQYHVHQYQQFSNPNDKFALLADDPHSQSSNATTPSRNPPHPRESIDRYTYENLAERPAPLHVHHRDSTPSHTYQSSTPPSQAYSTNPPPPLPPPVPPQESYYSDSPPPVPPKTPIQSSGENEWRQPQRAQSNAASSTAGRPLPYPDIDGPPPPVNMAKKPQYGVRP